MLPGWMEACLQAPGKSEHSQADEGGVRMLSAYPPYSIPATGQKEEQTQSDQRGQKKTVGAGKLRRP